jgi:hypothetical protein
VSWARDFRNPLADDSDDERRFRQAETRAIRKRKASFPKEPPERFAADKLFRGISQPPERQNVNTTATNSQITYLSPIFTFLLRAAISCCELSRRCKASGKFPAVTALLIRDKSFETLSLKSH